MDNIHMPTVPSGPTSAGPANGVPFAHLSLVDLMAEKDRVEAEIKGLSAVLDSVRSHRARSPAAWLLGPG